MENLLSPVLCDDCSALAFAEIDGRILCVDCLLAAVRHSVLPDAIARIRPLPSGVPVLGPEVAALLAEHELAV